MGSAANNAVLTVACVYKPGGGFSDEYVYRLRDGIAEHCNTPYKFVCLTNNRFKNVETIPLRNSRIGYWNKLELFRNDLFDGPVVYLDLDTIIVGDITDMLIHPHKFTAGLNFKAKHGRSLASWFLGFDGREDYSYLIDEYKPSTPEEYSQDWSRWGDQGFIQNNLRREWQSLDEIGFANRYASYKWHVRRPGKVPDGCDIVCFHGKPRPHEVDWKLPNGS